MNRRGPPSPAMFALFSIFSVPSALAQNNSPQDKPVASSAEQLKKFEEAIAPYVKKARETLPEAKKKTPGWSPEESDLLRHHPAL